MRIFEAQDAFTAMILRESNYEHVEVICVGLDHKIKISRSLQSRILNQNRATAMVIEVVHSHGLV